MPRKSYYQKNKTELMQKQKKRRNSRRNWCAVFRAMCLGKIAKDSFFMANHVEVCSRCSVYYQEHNDKYEPLGAYIW
jgi:hypothetical protein